MVGVEVLNLGDRVPLSFTQVPIWRVEMSMGARVVDVTFVISAAVAVAAAASAPVAVAAGEVGVVVLVVSLIGALRHITSMMEPLLSSTVRTVRRSYSSRVRM